MTVFEKAIFIDNLQSVRDSQCSSKNVNRKMSGIYCTKISFLTRKVAFKFDFDILNSLLVKTIKTLLKFRNLDIFF